MHPSVPQLTTSSLFASYHVIIAPIISTKTMAHVINTVLNHSFLRKITVYIKNAALSASVLEVHPRKHLNQEQRLLSQYLKT